MPCSKQPPYSITASARGEFPWCCKAVSGSLRRQRQGSPLETSRGNGSPEAQRWHAGAEGSLAQISGVCLSCIQVPSNGEEHEKDSDDDPNIDAGHNGNETTLR